MAHCLLKKPLAVPLVMFPSSSYYTSMHFQQTDRALRPLWVAWERRKTGEFVLPAETCVLVFHRMSAWSIWALRWHRITRLKVPCRDIESIWWRTVRRKLLNICFCSGSETLSRRRVVGETYCPFFLDNMIWSRFLWLFLYWTSKSHFHYAAAEHCLLV